MFKRAMKDLFHKCQVRILARRIRHIQNMLLKVEHQKRLAENSIQKIFGVTAEIKIEKDLFDILPAISEEKTSV